MKIKIRKTDSLFSKYIRKRDNYTCQRCEKKYPEKSQGLHCSHFFGRRAESTRFEPLNADAICMGCHSYFHANPFEYTIWKKRQLGEESFNLLELQKNTYKKRDDVMNLLYIEKLL